MDMKIKAKDNKVTFVMRAGKHFVQNTIPLSSAEQLIKNGKVAKDEQVAALSNGNSVKYTFPGHVCHLFSKETGINLEA